MLEELGSRGVIVSIKFESTLDTHATTIQLNAANVLFAIAVAYSHHGYLDHVGHTELYRESTPPPRT